MDKAFSTEIEFLEDAFVQVELGPESGGGRLRKAIFSFAPCLI